MSTAALFAIPAVVAVALLGSLFACFYAGFSKARTDRDIERAVEST